MPTGTINWFDPETGKGRVRTRAGKQYPIAQGEAERDATARAARVHFDIKHIEGIDWAMNVRLCRGTRVHRLQHRFGDVAGRRSHPVGGDRSASTLLALWLDAVARGDIDAASALYAPDACVHIGEDVVRGRRSIRSHLDREIAAAGIAVMSVETPDERSAVARVTSARDGSQAEIRIRAEHDEIAEQWL
jgi:hypothetical protein